VGHREVEAGFLGLFGHSSSTASLKRKNRTPGNRLVPSPPGRRGARAGGRYAELGDEALRFLVNRVIDVPDRAMLQIQAAAARPGGAHLGKALHVC